MKGNQLSVNYHIIYNHQHHLSSFLVYNIIQHHTFGADKENLLHPLTPRIDQHETSPNNILTLPSKQLMRIFKLIR